jgi:energy-coupling factor transporter transmembrane protein EcfT
MDATGRRPFLRLTGALFAITCLAAVVSSLDSPLATVLLFPGVGFTLLVVAGVTAHATGRWFLGAVGFVLLFVGLAPLGNIGGCAGCACEIPAGYEYWRHLRAGFTFTSPIGLGPAVRVTGEPVGCLCGCPYYYLPIGPIFAGHGALVLAVLLDYPRESFPGPLGAGEGL